LAQPDDGSVRFYDPPEDKVKAAIRSLGDSVSSIAFASGEQDCVWLASGINVFRFYIKGDKLIYNSTEADKHVAVGQDA